MTPTYSEFQDGNNSAEVAELLFEKDGSPAEDYKLGGGEIKVILPLPFGNNWDPGLHKRNSSGYNNFILNLFETNKSQGYSINKKIKCNEFIIEDGSTYCKIEKTFLSSINMEWANHVLCGECSILRII